MPLDIITHDILLYEGAIQITVQRAGLLEQRILESDQEVPPVR